MWYFKQINFQKISNQHRKKKIGRFIKNKSCEIHTWKRLHEDVNLKRVSNITKYAFQLQNITCKFVLVIFWLLLLVINRRCVFQYNNIFKNYIRKPLKLSALPNILLLGCNIKYQILTSKSFEILFLINFNTVVNYVSF